MPTKMRTYSKVSPAHQDENIFKSVSFNSNYHRYKCSFTSMKTCFFFCKWQPFSPPKKLMQGLGLTTTELMFVRPMAIRNAGKRDKLVRLMKMMIHTLWTWLPHLNAIGTGTKKRRSDRRVLHTRSVCYLLLQTTTGFRSIGAFS